MDTPNEDDLSDLERRLANWQPAAERLDTDSMLFAAGRAAGRRGWGRRLWPACCVLLATQAVGLLVWGLSERAERQVLTDRLHKLPAAHDSPPAPAVFAEFGYTPSASDYLHLRRAMEQDPSGGQAFMPPESAPVEQPPEPAILTPRLRDGLLEQ
jgi:hypothetical protein